MTDVITKHWPNSVLFFLFFSFSLWNKKVLFFLYCWCLTVKLTAEILVRILTKINCIFFMYWQTELSSYVHFIFFFNKLKRFLIVACSGQWLHILSFNKYPWHVHCLVWNLYLDGLTIFQQVVKAKARFTNTICKLNCLHISFTSYGYVIH